MTAPSLYLHFRALGRPFLWAAYFRPSVHTGANECGSFAPVLFLFALHCLTLPSFAPAFSWAVQSNALVHQNAWSWNIQLRSIGHQRLVAQPAGTLRLFRIAR
jgi:hypothetical protein